MEELSDNIYELITQLVDEGKEHSKKEEYQLSTDKYKKAIRLLSNPVYEWEAFSWLTSNIGLNYLKLENWKDSFRFLNYSLLTSTETNDPLIWFSAGKALYNMDKQNESKNFFIKAYLLSKEFFNEQDSEYKNLIDDDLQLINECANLSNNETR